MSTNRCPTCGQLMRSALVQAVLKNISRRGTSVADIKRAVKSFRVDDKVVYNVIAYLNRHGRIKQLERGLYSLPTPPAGKEGR